jgi:hypothetical protein
VRESSSDRRLIVPKTARNLSFLGPFADNGELLTPPLAQRETAEHACHTTPYVLGHAVHCDRVRDKLWRLSRFSNGPAP